MAVAAVGVVSAMVGAEAGLARSDRPVAQWAAEHATSRSTDAVRLVSWLGGTEVVVLLAAVVAALELRRRRPSRAVPAVLALTVGGQFAVVNAIKWVVDRARPDVLRLTGFAGASFPSGHAAAAAASYACFALVLGRGRSRRTRAALAGVAATRVVLGVHWLTDALAGTLVGWAWFALGSIAFGDRLLRFGAPVRVGEEVAAAAEEERRRRTG